MVHISVDFWGKIGYALKTLIEILRWIFLKFQG
jgi:hypothetical protein